MRDHSTLDYTDRAHFYRELISEMTGMLERPWFTNLATASAVLMQHLPDINWVGFYLAVGAKDDAKGGIDDELILGPFQGRPACLKIPSGKGVCGAAARARKTLIVPDVEKFPGHIVCDSRSRSEIVVPLLLKDRLLGVLDVDSPILSRFSAEDRDGLEKVAQVLADRSWWPEQLHS